MIDTKPEIISTVGRDGKPLHITVPRTRLDVEMQPDIPARVLALLAFSTKVDGRRRWSDFTRQTFRNLEQQYGDSALRTTLAALLDEINMGLKPTNPIGLFIHRVRLTANSDNLGL